MFQRIQFWRSPATVFTTIASLFGILLIFIIPPFQSPDEYQHFYRAFQLSEGQIIAESQQGDCYGYSNYFADRPCAGGTLPKSLLTTVRTASKEDLRFRPERKQNITDIFAILDLPLNPEDRVFIKFPTIVLYSPIPYLPQILGIATARFLNFSPLGMMYVGRFFNLLFWLIIGYWSIRISPIFKWGFVGLLLMPMSVFQSASLSADVSAIGTSFLWLAFCLYCAFVPEKLNPKFKILLYLLPLSIALTKQAYLPLVFLYWLIPISKIGSLRKYILTFSLILSVCVGCSLIWYQMTSQIYVPLFENVSLSGQLSFLSKNPFHLFRVITKSIVTFGGSYIEEFVGKLGWLDTRLPMPAIISYPFFLVILVMGSGDRPFSLTWQQKMISAGISILNFCLIVTLFYLTLTPVGADKVIYIQGRYLIPLSPLLFLSLTSIKLNWMRGTFRTYAIAYIFAIEIISIVSLMNRYYF